MRNNDGEPWYNNNMKESDLPDLKYGYILSTTYPGGNLITDYLLTTGEIVMGTPCSMKSTVDWLVKEEGGRYLGVGVLHQ